MSDQALYVKCEECDWSWEGRVRHNPKRPDPKEIRALSEAMQVHSRKTRHNAVSGGLKEKRVFRFEGDDAPDLGDLTRLASHGTSEFLASLERAEAIGVRRRVSRKRSL